MPLIEVKTYDHRVTDETAKALVEKLTNAYCEATTEEVRPLVWVIVEGVPSKHWGIGGEVT